MGGGESQRWAEWEQDQAENIMGLNCRAMDALIDSLPPSQSCAIHHVYLGSTFRFPREEPIDLVARAMPTLLKGMIERVIL